MSTQQVDYRFEFSASYQEAVIGHCLKDPKFFSRCLSKLKVDWFTCGPLEISLYKQLIEFHKKHGHTPLYGEGLHPFEELFNESWFLSQTIADREKYRNAVTKCLISSNSFNLDILQKNLTGFLRQRMMMDTIKVGADKLNRSGYDDSYTWTKNRIKELHEASFLNEFNVEDLSSPIEWFKTQDVDNRAISCGLRDLDRAMGGGLFKGETCAIMAPTNMGKSRALLTFARHAIVQGYKVLYITHEDTKEKIKQRIYGSLIGLSPQQIHMALRRETRDLSSKPDQNGYYPQLSLDVVDRYQKYVTDQMTMVEKEIIQPNLTFLPFVKTGKMFAEDLIEEIKKLNEDQILRTGRGYDMIVDDYPKKLKLRHKSSDSMLRTELADIYDMFNQLAIELDVHCMVAVQTNRAGARANKGVIETDRFLGTEEVDESYGIAQNMGCVVTLNRSDDDKKCNIVHYNVAKSRNERNDVAVSARANYAASLLHGDWDLFKKYGPMMLLTPLGSVFNDTNKKIPTSEANKMLSDAEGDVRKFTTAYLEQNGDIACQLPPIGK